MAVTSNTYTGNGTNKLFSITFPYLDTSDIDVYLNGTLQTITTQYTFANATTVEFVTAPSNGATVLLKRSTDDSDIEATFFPGSSIKAVDLNENFDQVLYIAQETANEAASATAASAAATTTANTALSNSATAVSTANTASTNASAAVTTANAANATANTALTNSTTAINTANSAVTTANGAVSTANAASATATTASTNASNAVTTANTASTNASAAVATANTASTNASTAISTANSAVTTANNAVTTANSAVTTANSAVTTANSAVTTANSALNNSNTAISTANSAIAAVAAAVIYTPVANLTALAALTPSNGDFFELTDSTGAEGSALITGVTVGLVGAPGLTFRLRYDAPPGIFTFIGYFANDSETRYLKLQGGTMTGQLLGDNSTSAATPGFAFDGDPNTGVLRPGADELALVTGGTARLTIDPAGAVSIPGTLGVTGAITGSLTGSASNNVLKAGDTMTGALATPLGSASTPSLTFTGDPNTGIYSPGADQVAVATNGTGRITIDGSGNVNIDSNTLYVDATNNRVGVGTSSPTVQLDVSTSASEALRLQSVSNNTNTALNAETGLLLRNTNTTVGNMSSITNRDGNNNANSQINFVNTDQAGSGAIAFTTRSGGSFGERVRIDSSGRVGIGTSGPTARLTIAGGTANDYTDGILLSKSGGNVYGIYASTNNLEFRSVTGSKHIATFDYDGRVGIGTTSPGTILDISDPGTGLRFSNAGGGNFNIGLLAGTTGAPAYVYQRAAASLIFGTSDTERARIDASGRLLVGTSSARTNIDYALGTTGSQLQIEQANATTNFSIVQNFDSGTTGAPATLTLARSGATSIGSTTIVANGNRVGEINFSGSDGTDFTVAACIRGEIDGTPAANDMPGRLVFSTTADGASGPTERFRITNNGSFFSVIPGGSTIYPQFACRAWVNFNGTGTVAIRASGNVSSITDNGVGNYTVNFATAMPDADYCAVYGTQANASGRTTEYIVGFDGGPYSTTALRIEVWADNGSNYDVPVANVAIFR